MHKTIGVTQAGVHDVLYTCTRALPLSRGSSQWSWTPVTRDTLYFMQKDLEQFLWKSAYQPNSNFREVWESSALQGQSWGQFPMWREGDLRRTP